MTRRRLLVAGLAAALLAAPPARAEISRLGIFRHDTALPHVLMLQGEIDRTALRDFRAATLDRDITVLMLDSPGGRIHASLDLAKLIRARALATVIPEGAECASACAFLFVAGTRRQALGRLGVHRFTSDNDSRRSQARTEAETQEIVGRIVTLLSAMGTQPGFFVAMFGTPNSDMHWFTPRELADGRLVTGDDFATELAAWRGLQAEGQETAMDRALPEPPGLPPPGQTPAVGPGLDCAAPLKADEALICADARLAALDLALTRRIDRLARTMSAMDAARFRLSQLTWTAARNACATDYACIEAAYLERLDKLGY